ncbi:hypothetical protein SAMD00019534_105810, partial [Acytostelium subglobosum LB1]|uniref:hypothetical protein n=1 Tax=Acytostelium subglobosum LB1 TaxID=1410327 RepID=UPI0006450E32
MIKALAAVKEWVNTIDEQEKNAGPNVTDFNKFEKSYANVQKLIDLQAALKKTQKDQPQQEVVLTENQIIEQFQQWLVSNGCAETFTKVKIVKNLAEGAGLVAITDIKEGEEFIVVPHKLFMTQETALKSFGDKVAKDRMFMMLPNMPLVIQLIQEKVAKQSFWAPYIRMLPKTYKTSLYFTLDEYRLLQGSPVLDEAINTFRNTIRQYCYLYDFLTKNIGIVSTSVFTWEMYVWALSTLMSRQNQIPLTAPPKGGHGHYHGSQMSLVPFWDLCNHLVSGRITTFYETDRHALTCSAVKPFKAGDQVYIHYGDRNNVQLLLYSGFCLKNNPYDNFKLKLQLDPAEPMMHEKIHILEERGLSSMGHVFLANASTPAASEPSLPDAVIPFFRVYAMNEKEVEKFAPNMEQHHHDHSSSLNEPNFQARLLISEQNEQAAYNSLLAYLKKKLASYPTTLVEDEQHLAKNPINFVRFTLYIRITEKKVLERYIKLVESMIQKGVMT